MKCYKYFVSVVKSIFSTAKRAVKYFLIILLVTGQSGTRFNAFRESSTASSNVS